MFAAPLIAALTLATTALAVPGKASIGSPQMWDTIHAGQNAHIRVEVEPIPQNIDEVGIALGLQSCEVGKCQLTNDTLGTIIYKGAFSPVYHGDVAVSLPPHQNFSINIPADFPKGHAILGLISLATVGASNAPLYSTYNISVNIA
ncbi:hypothetical protein Moror_17071 [Moniliophthora roreri MCA 2997]|uniref:Uncharacterized protein n=1 Tax=Moniliophthora roreri (strain MCA 2997) TaxID=1381753 RepID=V2X4T7_MONRO|nr:hypothetical protein Moror_17071 [Moniliophthora roreri MCA 2997]